VKGPLTDSAIRATFFRWLKEQVDQLGPVLPSSVLGAGFSFEGRSIPAVSRAGRGIWKPSILDSALSILTGPNSPYGDDVEDDLILYRYQGTNPRHSDNRSLRRAMEHGLPLAYFHAVESGHYFTTWPVYIVADDPAELTFRVQADPKSLSLAGSSLPGPLSGASIGSEDLRRSYGTTEVKIRYHQARFRHQVLTAYKTRCAMCNLGHQELLDAAHIIPDAEGGRPTVTNGLSLCKIHHAAFDNRVLGINPDGYRVAVRQDILEEVDGPMLLHGIQEMDGAQIYLPRSREKRPDLDALARQWTKFRRAH
jgi:putative restriction endonuclease